MKNALKCPHSLLLALFRKRYEFLAYSRWQKCAARFQYHHRNSRTSEPVKYEADKESGLLFVDRFIGTGMRYPANYGFIPHTRAGDGDPVDVLVITPFPILAGAVIRARALGLLQMNDES